MGVQKEALAAMLMLLTQTIKANGDLYADVSALSSVVFALSPEASNALEEQRVLERDKIQKEIQTLEEAIERIRIILSKSVN